MSVYHHLEAAFRDACRTLGAVIQGGTIRTMDDECDNSIVCLNVDKYGYNIAGDLRDAGLNGISRSYNGAGKNKTYMVTITCPIVLAAELRPQRGR